MRFLLCILLALVALAGFSALAEDDYYPLAVGDERTMVITYSINLKSLSGIVHTMTEANVSKDGKEYVRQRLWSDGLPKKIELRMLLRKSEQGVYSLDEDHNATTEQTELALPLKVNATWKRTMQGRHMTDTVIGMETVEVAGKIYAKCWHVQTVSLENTQDAWFAPSVGLIKAEVKLTNGLRISESLKEFKPGK